VLPVTLESWPMAMRTAAPVMYSTHDLAGKYNRQPRKAEHSSHKLEDATHESESDAYSIGGPSSGGLSKRQRLDEETQGIRRPVNDLA